MQTRLLFRTIHTEGNEISTIESSSQSSGIAMILASVEFRYSRTTRWSRRCRDCSHDHFWDFRNSHLLRLRNLSTMKFKTSDVSILVILRYLGTHGLTILKFQISKIAREMEGDVELLKQNLSRFNNLSRDWIDFIFWTRGSLFLLDLRINRKRISKRYGENIGENIDKNMARRRFYLQKSIVARLEGSFALRDRAVFRDGDPLRVVKPACVACRYSSTFDPR